MLLHMIKMNGLFSHTKWQYLLYHIPTLNQGMGAYFIHVSSTNLEGETSYHAPNSGTC